MKNLSLQSLLPACYIEMKITTSIETLLDFSRFTSIPVFAKRRESQPIPKDAPLYFTFFLNRTRKFRRVSRSNLLNEPRFTTTGRTCNNYQSFFVVL
tara:strand:- start:2893 stop:3183 length:291 start_codon:yes stop_codon:yes gene_type:complete